MKSFRQFLTEIAVGQKMAHPSGEYLWRGGQWVKQGKGLKPVAKRDVAAELTQMAKDREDEQKRRDEKTRHEFEVTYSKPGERKTKSFADVYSRGLASKQQAGKMSGFAKKEFEKKGYTVHGVEHKGTYAPGQKHQEPIGPKRPDVGPPKPATNQQHGEPIGPQQKDKDQQHQEPIGPNYKKDTSQHKAPIGPPGPGTQQHGEPIGPKAAGQEHGAKIGPELPKGQVHGSPIGPKPPETKTPEAKQGEAQGTRKVHVWDKRKERSPSGTVRAKRSPIGKAIKKEVGKAADFLVTGSTAAYNESMNFRSFMKNLMNENRR